MRTTILAAIAAFGLGAAAIPANATPLAATVGAPQAANIIPVWGGCGPWRHPVPGHWRGPGYWVPPHCAPNHAYWGGRPYYWGWRHYY